MRIDLAATREPAHPQAAVFDGLGPPPHPAACTIAQGRAIEGIAEIEPVGWSEWFLTGLLLAAAGRTVPCASSR